MKNPTILIVILSFCSFNIYGQNNETAPDDYTILVSIIGGATTIIAAILSPLIKKIIEDQRFLPISKDRRNALKGEWSGTVLQKQKGNNELSFKVQLNLKIRGRRVIGSGILSSEKLHHVELDGTFSNDRFLKMDYRNKKTDVVQFGSFIFHLSDDSKKLDGLFIGYGHLSNSTVHGKCLLTKN